jgi:hypothetical protein
MVTFRNYQRNRGAPWHPSGRGCSRVNGCAMTLEWRPGAERKCWARVTEREGGANEGTESQISQRPEV